MDRQKILFLIINLLGGGAVLASYALGLGGAPGGADALWGGVAPGVRTMITVNMLFGASGYLYIFFLFLRRVPSSARVLGLPFGIVQVIYLLILVPSALWLPLTRAMVEAPSPVRWAAVVSVLILTAIGSIALLAAVITVKPRLASGRRTLAIIGGAFLALQTAVLDAIVWTASFPV